MLWFPDNSVGCVARCYRACQTSVMEQLLVAGEHMSSFTLHLLFFIYVGVKPVRRQSQKEKKSQIQREKYLATGRLVYLIESGFHWYTHLIRVSVPTSIDLWKMVKNVKYPKSKLPTKE